METFHQMNDTRNQIHRDTLLSRLNDGLIRFFDDFMEHPFRFFYEEDAKSHLFVHLEKIIGINAEFPIDERYSSLLRSDIITSSIVKTEYPRTGEVKRFDIAVLDPQVSRDRNPYEVPVSIAIELKLGSEHLGSDKTGDFKCDLSKLNLAKRIAQSHQRPFLGIAIYLHQTPIVQEEKFMSYYVNTLIVPLNKDKSNKMCLNDNSVYGIIVSPNQDGQAF